MLPRTKSIFHLGEEGDKVHKEEVAIRGLKSLMKPSEALVGLKILIQHQTQGSNVVVKPSIRSRMVAVQAWQFPRRAVPQESGFLKACLMCKKELNSQKDIYMYRGDQGFCSEECRRRQISLDERQELEASKRELRHVSYHRHARSKARQVDRPAKMVIAA
ncbi:FCS-Like Zinc finger 17-like [Typha angustifolia]|uniref:FCS-Like Zinc finger 17-like n=1 Tax=Typha angustifolia TaxID=59011 RepID=UPI003C2B4C57